MIWERRRAAFPAKLEILRTFMSLTHPNRLTQKGDIYRILSIVRFSGLGVLGRIAMHDVMRFQWFCRIKGRDRL
jgi:hypothetical protein